MLNKTSLDQYPETIKQFSSQKLCEIIVTARYLGSMREETITCMEELSRRRAEGDTFEYEEVIEQESKKLPNFKIDLKEKMSIGFNFSKLKGIV